MDKRKALGRGLSALIPSVGPSVGPSGPGRVGGEAGEAADGEVAVHAPPEGTAGSVMATAAGVRAATSRREFFLCPIEEIRPSRDNPRQRFDEQRLQELADSIRAQGLVQPLVVRLLDPGELKAEQRRPLDGSFVLIAGERRWRAAQRAGLKEVPVVVKDVSAAQAFELALVENLQREDLNPIEEAEAYRRLSDEFGYTQEELARRVGRERATVANSLRLLKLPDKVRDQVATQKLSMGHARALLGLESPERIELTAEQVMTRELSVRQTEDLVRRAHRQDAKPEKAKPESESKKTPAVRDVEDRLQKALGTRVSLRPKDARSGVIEVHYHSLDELDGLISRLTGSDASD